MLAVACAASTGFSCTGTSPAAGRRSAGAHERSLIAVREKGRVERPFVRLREVDLELVGYGVVMMPRAVITATSRTAATKNAPPRRPHYETETGSEPISDSAQPEFLVAMLEHVQDVRRAQNEESSQADHECAPAIEE